MQRYYINASKSGVYDTQVILNDQTGFYLAQAL